MVYLGIALQCSILLNLNKIKCIFNVLPFYRLRETEEMASAIAAGLQAGFLCPIVGHESQLSKAADAHRYITEGTGTNGKLVFRYSIGKVYVVGSTNYSHRSA